MLITAAFTVYWLRASPLSRIRLNSDYAEDGVKPRNLRIRPAGEPCAGLLVTRVEDPRDLGCDRQPAAAVSLRPDDVNVPVLQVHLTGLQGAGLTGPQPARVHQREECRRLPSPRRAGLQPRRRGEELLDPAQRAEPSRD